MAVGESIWPTMNVIAGVKLGVASAGIKYPDRKDVALITLPEGATVSGVFTQNAFCAAPITICREHLSQTSSTRALLINSGNANACTGNQGYQAAKRTCQSLAEHLKVTEEQILPFSTGVIGEPLPEQKIIDVMQEIIASTSEDNWLDFAKAIMTTDTRPKGASKTFEWQGHNINVSGVAKGSGMIRPNMATMLAYIATDAHVAPEVLNEISRIAANASFNRITIDGDTSTNDACMLIASGASKAPCIDSKQSPLYEPLLTACIDVYQSLSKQIVMDGEGATKCVAVHVKNGATAQESLDVAYAIAHSPLIKTALYASDPNWGRIVAAIGYAGIKDLDAKLVKVWLDDVLIVEDGGRAQSYREEFGKRIYSQAEFTITVDLGRGTSEEKIWTSDLSHEYIRINAEYRS